MPRHTTRRWICALILSLLGQLIWAASMTAPVETAPHAQAAHAVTATHSHHADAQCHPTPGNGEHGPTMGHACCPVMGLAPTDAPVVALPAQRHYGAVVTHGLHGVVLDAIFKPPKTWI